MASWQCQSSNACARRIRSRWQQWRSLVRSHSSCAHLVHVNVVSHVMARIVFEHCEHRCVWPSGIVSHGAVSYVCVFVAGFVLLAACLVTAGGLCFHCHPSQHRYALPGVAAAWSPKIEVGDDELEAAEDEDEEDGENHGAEMQDRTASPRGAGVNKVGSATRMALAADAEGEAC